MSTNRAWVIGLVLAALVSCRPDDQRTDSMNPQEALERRQEMAPQVVAHLDSGNALSRADDHAGALAHYRAAVELDPDAAAAWFGVYMAETALGNQEAAAEALARAREHVPGATLIHPTDRDTIR